MKENRRIEIDSARLRNAISKRGMSMTEASKKMGFSDAYLGVCVGRGFITPYAERMMDAMLNIPLGEYLPTKPKSEPVCPVYEEDDDDDSCVAIHINIDYDEIQRCIYHAIIGAFRKLQREGIDINEVSE